MTTRPKRPYLLRALYEWIVDSGLTPYVLVDAERDGVVVPSEFVENGRIVLNVAPSAVIDLTLDNDAVACQCRFRGQPFAVHLPMASIQAIYAKETGEGMAFEAEEFQPSPDDPGSGPDRSGGHLKVVK